MVAPLRFRRDRTLLGVLVYSFARVTAARRQTTTPRPARVLPSGRDGGGRYNAIPAHDTAQAYVDAYLAGIGIGEDRRGPLFRTCEPGRRAALQARAMPRLGALRMIKPSA